MTMKMIRMFICLCWATTASSVAVNSSRAIIIIDTINENSTTSAQQLALQSIEIELWFPTGRRRLDIPTETSVFAHLSGQYLSIQDILLNRFEILDQAYGPPSSPSTASTIISTFSSSSSSNGSMEEQMNNDHPSSLTRGGISGGSAGTTAGLMPKTTRAANNVVVIGPESMLQEQLTADRSRNILTVLVEIEAWNVHDIQPLLHDDWNSYLELLMIGLDMVFDDALLDENLLIPLVPSFTSNTTSSTTGNSSNNEQRYWTLMGTALGLSLGALAMVVAVRTSGRHGHIWRHHLMMDEHEGEHNNHHDDEDEEISTSPKNTHNDNDDHGEWKESSAGETPSSLGDGGPSVYFDHPPFFPEEYYIQIQEDPNAATLPTPPPPQELPIQYPPPDGNDNDDEYNNTRSSVEQVYPGVQTLVWI